MQTDMADNLTPAQRRRAMQAVKGRNTSLEQAVNLAFRSQGWKYRRNVTTLPGKPDFVFVHAKLVVFVDGDFWHGWRFPQWKEKLSTYWREKIERNRQRDQRNFRWLRRNGWSVLRIWGHDVERDSVNVVIRVKSLLERCSNEKNRLHSD